MCLQLCFVEVWLYAGILLLRPLFIVCLVNLRLTAGALLAVGIINSGVTDEVEPAFAILSGTLVAGLVHVACKLA